MTKEQILKKVDILKIQGIDEREYDNVHAWMRYNYGRPEYCEICGEYGTKKERWNIDWALKHGKLYKRKRENYIGVCKSCHQSYDNPMPEWCNTKGCDNPHYANGKCKRCYNRKYFRLKVGKNAWKWSKYDK